MQRQKGKRNPQSQTKNTSTARKLQQFLLARKLDERLLWPLIVTLLGGVLLAIIIQDARFDPSRTPSFLITAAPAANLGNLISNGDFSGGTNQWGNWPINAEGDFSNVNGELCTSIQNGGSSFSDYTVSPYALSITGNKMYHATFDARANDHRAIQFRAWNFNTGKEYYVTTINVTPQRENNRLGSVRQPDIRLSSRIEQGA